MKNKLRTRVCKTLCSYRMLILIDSQYDYWKTVVTSGTVTAQRIKFSIKDFFSKSNQIRKELQIWSHLLKKLLMENIIFCAVTVPDVAKVFQSL